MRVVALLIDFAIFLHGVDRVRNNMTQTEYAIKNVMGVPCKLISEAQEWLRCGNFDDRISDFHDLKQIYVSFAYLLYDHTTAENYFVTRVLHLPFEEDSLSFMGAFNIARGSGFAKLHSNSFGSVL